MDPFTILAALLPVAQDGIRAMVNKFTGGAGAKPANVDEAIKMIDAETKRLEAIAKIDTPAGNVSSWVNNVRALMRPVSAGIILLAYFATFLFATNAGLATNAANLAASVVFYLFGDRTVMHIRQDQKVR